MIKVVRLRNFVDLPSGITLETLHSAPGRRPEGEGSKLAVPLHPWSWLGGNMDDPVLDSLDMPLIDKGYNVLRFNSRGVGKSKGWSSLTGLTEAEDLQALVQWEFEAIPDVRTLVVLGYSHGSLIASLHPVLASPVKTLHVLLSYPLSPRGPLTLFHSKTYASALSSLLHEAASNVLIIYGDDDEFTGSAKYDTWAEELQKETEAPGSGLLNIVKVTDGTHFWNGEKGDEMRRAIEEWLP